jgi:hypothetical protein
LLKKFLTSSSNFVLLFFILKLKKFYFVWETFDWSNFVEKKNYYFHPSFILVVPKSIFFKFQDNIFFWSGIDWILFKFFIYFCIHPNCPCLHLKTIKFLLISIFKFKEIQIYFGLGPLSDRISFKIKKNKFTNISEKILKRKKWVI